MKIFQLISFRLVNSFSRLVNSYFRFDRSGNGGGIIQFIPEDIPAKLLGSQKCYIEIFNVELNLRGQKWLINCSYNPFKALIGEHLKLLSKNLGLQSSKHKRFVFIGGFNENKMKQ